MARENDPMSSVDAMLEPFLADLRDVLGPSLVGLYLYGSAVEGGFDEGVSDVDLLAVTSVAAARLDLKRLDAVHRAVIARDPSWEDRLEIVYVSAGAVADSAATAEQLAVVSPGEPFHLSGPVADWLQNWYFVRRRSVALVPRKSLAALLVQPDSFNAMPTRSFFPGSGLRVSWLTKLCASKATVEMWPNSWLPRT